MSSSSSVLANPAPLLLVDDPSTYVSRDTLRHVLEYDASRVSRDASLQVPKSAASSCGETESTGYASDPDDDVLSSDAGPSAPSPPEHRQGQGPGDPNRLRGDSDDSDDMDQDDEKTCSEAGPTGGPDGVGECLKIGAGLRLEDIEGFVAVRQQSLAHVHQLVESMAAITTEMAERRHRGFRALPAAAPAPVGAMANRSFYERVEALRISGQHMVSAVQGLQANLSDLSDQASRNQSRARTPCLSRSRSPTGEDNDDRLVCDIVTREGGALDRQSNPRPNSNSNSNLNANSGPTPSSSSGVDRDALSRPLLDANVPFAAWNRSRRDVTCPSDPYSGAVPGTSWAVPAPLRSVSFSALQAQAGVTSRPRPQVLAEDTVLSVTPRDRGDSDPIPDSAGDSIHSGVVMATMTLDLELCRARAPLPLASRITSRYPQLLPKSASAFDLSLSRGLSDDCGFPGVGDSRKKGLARSKTRVGLGAAGGARVGVGVCDGNARDVASSAGSSPTLRHGAKGRPRPVVLRWNRGI